MEREVKVLKAACEGHAHKEAELVRLVPYIFLHPCTIAPTEAGVIIDHHAHG